MDFQIVSTESIIILDHLNCLPNLHHLVLHIMSITRPQRA